ncbi:Coronin-like protein crn1 [Myotisia sp. PD_48]|nr:Coronin-like protein crn1 [Myotisia sp. PD_48]
MAGRFVRASKYRHVFGRSTRKEQCYDNLHVSANAWDTNLLKVNPEYISVNWETSGGGAFAVIPINETGKLPERFPLFRGHTAVVLDTDWNPFNDSLIASSSDDGKIFLWRVPEGFTLRSDAEEVSDISPVGKLPGHTRKVGHVLFNPAAENVLASASGDYSVKLWDIEAGQSNLSLKVGDMIQSMSWSANGSLLVTTSRDKKLRIWDVRQEKPVHEGVGHSGGKNSRAVWMGEHERVATTGFSKMSDRQLALWDIRAAREPVNGFKLLDSISGVCMPFWDEGTQCLYLAGKGDGNIRYFEYENDNFEYLSEYKSSDPQRGVALMPKRGVDVRGNEVVRIFKSVSDSYIEPISFVVPRRAEVFQDDIYPPAVGITPAMSSKEWLDGKEALPPKIDMESLYEGKGMKEASPDSIPPKTEKAKDPQPVKKPEPKPEPVSKPAPAATSPPASMKEQGASMAAMASKFMDDDNSADEADDTSSFEEIPKATEKVPEISISPAETPTPAVQKSIPQPKISTPPATTRAAEKPVGDDTNVSQPQVLKELETIKALLVEQTRIITAQTQRIGLLTAEVEDLKAKIE